MISKIPELKKITDCFKSLKEKGIIRSNNLVGDLGEYYCKQNFGITLSDSKVQKGYDGVDEKGSTVQIKTRKTPIGSASVYFKNLEFDYCLFIELTENYELVEVLKISRKEIRKNLFKDNIRTSVSRIKNKAKNAKIKLNTE
tara:strand:- start:2038 stop:2463 length:426 start_codon:yes stop_codon:yes gene_type:complete